MQPVANAVDVEAEIFELLKRRGPLCASQIVVRLSLPPKEIDKALKKLEADGIIERRPDRDRSIPYDESETPWGLVRPRWVHKLFTKRS